MKVELPPNLPLNAAFLALMSRISRAGLGAVVGGGYGLYLKELLIRQNRLRTAVPEVAALARTTADIDLFLDIAVLADPGQAAALRDILTGLGFRDRPEALYYQFERPAEGGVGGCIRVDLETGPVPGEYRPLVRERPNDRRVSPRPKGTRLNAHSNPAAIGLEESVVVEVSSAEAPGTEDVTPVRLPQPFSYAIMKAMAYSDKVQLGAGEADNAARHAWDLLRIAAMTTQAELQSSISLCYSYASEPVLFQAREILASDFASAQSPGVLRALTQVSSRPEAAIIERCTRFLCVVLGSEETGSNGH